MANWKNASIVALPFLALVALAPAQDETPQAEPEAKIIARVHDFKIDEEFLRLSEAAENANKERLGDGPAYRRWAAGVQDRMLRTFIFNKMREKYSLDNGITASNEEVDAFLRREQQARVNAIMTLENRIMDIETEITNLNAQGKPITNELVQELKLSQKKMDRLQKDPSQMLLNEGQKNLHKELDRDRATKTILVWKFNKTIHEQFGGRIVPQNLTYEPFEAYARWLEVSESLGEFEIYDKKRRRAFWVFFRKERPNAMQPFPGMYDELRWSDTDLP